MKHLRMVGLAVLSALGAMAFVGAGTAQATELCTDSACTTKYPNASTFFATMASGSSMRFTANGGTVATCTGSLIHGFTSPGGVEKVEITVGEFSHSNCSQTTSTVSKGKIDIESTGGGNGSVWGTGNQITVAIFGVTCVYGSGVETKVGSITGGTAPSMKISGFSAKRQAGFFARS